MTNATMPTDVDPADFLGAVGPVNRRREGEALVALMSEMTGVGPVMWGPSMVGFGMYSYRYPTGRTGDFFRVGFSPRKAALSLYGLKDGVLTEAMLGDLGPHTTGAGCIYVKHLDALDQGVLRTLVRLSYELPKAHEA